MARIATALWIAWAIVVWNVVFDRVLVLAGRRYVYAAYLSARDSNGFLNPGDAMRPAIVRGFWLASVSAGTLAAIGLVSVAALSRRRHARDAVEETPS
jgi:hypothetical protein